MNSYDRKPWNEHLAAMNAWRQGEHMLVSGPTSSGKTTLIRPLLDKRTYKVALFTKMKDPTIPREYKGWKRVERWPRYGFNPQTEREVMIWPKPEKTMAATIRKQREIMTEAIDRIASEGNRAVFLDELLYLTDARYCNLNKEIGMLYYFGRSAGISAIGATQRPFYIPRVILSSVTYAYFARTYDAGDQKRLSELGSLNPREVVGNMNNLTDRHDFMFLNPQGDMPAAIVNTRK